ncbi:N-formylglutamate amidohydrolase [Kordiimonas pumila]|uniref:N-formylglutamate amidohydrolase n=1 Tax=Kordiimonas pumila TaxID=2161677 RepID=A0ABV7D7M3_9PROT|nr:N-formylglutamate amidohydrolase [Kordiimonas pumila]
MTNFSLASEILNPNVIGDVIILCDHATNHIPENYQNLGLGQADLERHIAWDIGAAEVTRKICSMMGVAGVLAPVSRLLIDCNREPDHATLIPPQSDGTIIPANRDLPESAVAARKKAYYVPFHMACADLVEKHLNAGKTPIIIGMHSFTPVMKDEGRPWHIGFLWNKDPRLAQAMIGLLERETDLIVGDNLPYSGKDLYYTMQRHGADNGLPQTTIEIRQDLLADDKMTSEWAALLADVLDECTERHDIMSIQYY